jgi:hypothetical protein
VFSFEGEKTFFCVLIVGTERGCAYDYRASITHSSSLLQFPVP